MQDPTTIGSEPSYTGAPRAKDQFSSLQRVLVRIFALSYMLVIAVDVAPTDGALGWLANYGIKPTVETVTGYSGLWQRSWSMFAPDPEVANLWVSADLYDELDRNVGFWNSPYWGNESGWEKFRNFRAVNYYNRFCVSNSPGVGTDLASFLVRSPLSPLVDRDQVAAAEVFANSLELQFAEKGSIPAPNEMVWVTKSTIKASTRTVPAEFPEFKPLWHTDDQ
ncbi:MAG: hypothetical protein ACE361_03775 [Aureliella sp.]